MGEENSKQEKIPKAARLLLGAFSDISRENSKEKVGQKYLVKKCVI